MHKLILVLLMLPALAVASPFANGTTNPFEPMVGELVGFMPALFGIVVVATVFAVIVRHMTTGGDSGDTFKPLILLMMLAPAMMLANFFFGVFDSGPSTQPSEPETAGVFSWLGDHWMVLVLAVVAVAVAVVFITLQMEKRALIRKVKEHRRELLDVISQVDELRQGWELSLTFCKKKEWKLGLPFCKNKGEEAYPDHVKAADIMSALLAISERLIPMLDQVHGGVPMSQAQEARLAGDRKMLVDRADVFAPPPAPSLEDKAEAAAVAPVARFTPAAPPVGIDGRPVQQRAALLTASPLGRSDDLFNPLVVLSLLSGAAHACGLTGNEDAPKEVPGMNTYINESQDSPPTFDADNSN